MKIKILIGHPYWGRGGAEFATMWLIQALKDQYQISVITRGGWDLKSLNKFANTTIEAENISLVKLPFSKLLSQTKGGAIWNGFFLRYCRRIGKSFDIRISAARPIDWGLPAVHILADVFWNDELYLKFGPPKTISETSGVRYLLGKIGTVIEGRSNRLIRDDRFIANSKWTAEISLKYCLLKPVIIYPPVLNIEFQKDWNSRENDFVYLGRISEEKKLEQAIEIIEAVRNKGNLINFHIVGKIDSSIYSTKILKICESKKSWIKLYGSKYGNEKYDILTSYKYGINCCEVEAFGISTVEMIKAGMIPFINSSGGQKEIVNNEALCFINNEDAVLKICNLIKNNFFQDEILNELRVQTKKFSTEKFSSDIQSFIQRIN